MKKYFFIGFFFSLLSLNAFSQALIPMPKIPVMRQIFHFNIEEAQKKIIHLDASTDSLFNASNNEKENIEITNFLHLHIHNLQASIELDTTLAENDKFIWLRAVENLLNDFIYAYKNNNIKGIQLTQLILAFEKAMDLHKNQQSIIPVIFNNPLEIDNIIFHNPAFENNLGYIDCRDNIVLKMCTQQPTNVLRILTRYPTVYFADSIIRVFAYKNQEELYAYAAADNELGDKIKACTDPLVKVIAILSKKNVGRMYFPFLDLLYRDKISFETIAKAVENDDSYYKLLVKTEIGYANRRLQGDTPLVYKTLIEKLRGKAIDLYINEINALHDEKSDAVRFKKIESLSPVELYYLCVLGEEEIYTSSYLGVYKRIFERLKPASADSLIHLVHFDFFKKFIKMAASYNQLDDFLSRMSVDTADKIMRTFVNDLNAKTAIEDAVDVANSFSSITNPKISSLIIDQLQNNLFDDTAFSKNTNTVYRILYTIFLSINPAYNINLTDKLGINPVFNMPISLLKDTSGRIIIQQFFYGDKDGGNIFDAFLNKFRTPNWKIIQSKEWVEVKSTKGTPISIYSNKPLDTEKDLDAKAQKDLNNYLDSLGFNPSVVIHRGHSYYVKYTIQQLEPSAKIVLLGSCGGYQSLKQVLKICPEAHIISSKQVGTGSINQELINVITEKLRLGKDLNWPVLWKEIENKYIATKDKEKFSDYVPPHKNLGAIFIMAYQKAIENEN